jgi:hypothetical protein
MRFAKKRKKIHLSTGELASQDNRCTSLLRADTRWTASFYYSACSAADNIPPTIDEAVRSKNTSEQEKCPPVTEGI